MKVIAKFTEKMSLGLHGEGVFLVAELYDNGDKENNLHVNLGLFTECHGTHQTNINMTEVSLDSIIKAAQDLKVRLNAEVEKQNRK